MEDYAANNEVLVDFGRLDENNKFLGYCVSVNLKDLKILKYNKKCPRIKKSVDILYIYSFIQKPKWLLNYFAFLPQQFLYFLPLPHGHGSLRPTTLPLVFA